MKTTSARFKGNGEKGVKPDTGKAGAAIAIGIASLGGAAFIFYLLIINFTTFTGSDVWPYVYYSLAFAGLMFAAYLGFHFYNKYRVKT